MRSGLTLDAFLASCRARGIRIGVDEEVRLSAALDLWSREIDDEATRGPADRLRSLLSCTLAKSEEQRETLAELFDLWVKRADWELASRQGQRPAYTPPRQREAVEAAPSPVPERKRLLFGALAAIGLVIGVLLIVRQRGAEPPSTDPGLAPRPSTTVDPVVPDSEDESSLRPGLQPEFTDWTPELVDLGRSPSPAWLIALAVLLLGTAWTVRYLCLRRDGAGSLDPEPDQEEPLPPAPVAPPPDVAAALLTPEERRMLVWSVEHFTSEDTTPELDLERTVDATAGSGGMIELHHRHATYPREVWLWRDLACEDTPAEILEEELSDSLARAGLPVRTARIWGTPELGEWNDSGEVVTARVLEGHRDQTILAVLTDGRGMQAAGRHALREQRLEECLRSLSTWPRLAFVDLAHGRHGLAARVARHGIRCLSPDALAGWIGSPRSEGAGPRALTVAAAGQLRAWAAALALGEEPFDVRAALDVRVRLGLRGLPADHLPDLLALAEPRAGRHAFTPARRAELCDWLGRTSRPAGARPGGPCVASGSWLEGALAYWRSVRNAALDAWSALPEPERDPFARDALRLELALLELWTDPEAASLELLELAGEGHSGAVRRRLEHLAPAGAERATSEKELLVRLPWRLETSGGGRFPDYPTRERLRRLGMRIPASATASAPRLPRATGFAVASLVGVAAALGVLACLETVRGPRVLPGMPDAARADGAFVDVDTYEVLAGTRARVERFDRPVEGGDATVRWTRTTRPNPEEREGIRIYYRGRRVEPLRDGRERGPLRSVAIVEAPAQDVDAERLAQRLLDGGWVDAVLVGEDWEDSLESFLGPPGVWRAEDQWLAFMDLGSFEKGLGDRVESFPGALACVQVARLADLDRPGGHEARSVADWWPGRSEVIRGSPEVRLPVRTKPPEMVPIPAGTFWMGSPEGERGRDSDERRHPVRLDAFRIGRYEVTRGEYRSVMGEVPGEWADDGTDGRLPANHVTWYDAIAFCNALSAAEGLELAYRIDETEVERIEGSDGYRLPTEAEWEYACRAGTTTRFWSGDAEADLARVGWYSANSEGQIHPVGEKEPNAWGLHDVHGNAWEWCEDRFGPYPESPAGEEAVYDPRGPSRGAGRVVRGGSFWFDAGGCRSAGRSIDGPADRGSVFGFRVVLPARPE